MQKKTQKMSDFWECVEKMYELSIGQIPSD